jgi:uncharacterized membrane protein
MLWEIVLIVAAVSGFFVALYIRHKKTRNEKMVCYLGQDCSKVIHSRFSIFFGIPVEILGILYYALTAIAYGILAAFPHLATPGISFTLLGMSAAAFLFTLYLVFIQAFTLKEWCTWCLFSAGICVIIFAAALTNLNHNIMDFLASIKGLVLIGHVMGMAVGVGAATIADVFFFRFLKDFHISESESEIMQILSQVIWAALGIAVLTGLALYLPQADVLNESVKFLVKAIVVTVIIVNGAFLNLYISPHLAEISFGEAHHHRPGELHQLRKFAFASGAVSLTSWYTALILGMLKSAPITFHELLAIYIGALAVAITISQLVERSYSRWAQEVE